MTRAHTDAGAVASSLPDAVRRAATRAPSADEGYYQHQPEALWNAWTVSFVANSALDGVEWASQARSAAAAAWEEQLAAAGLWPMRGRMRQRVLAGVYFGAGAVLHLLQRREDISAPIFTLTAQWPMRELPLLTGGG